MPRPIVLAHGIARFDFLFASLGFDLYFKGVPRHLARSGLTAFRSRVDFAGSLAKRAGELAGEVKRILALSGADKVHIIAHSMGGLDARSMIVDFGMAGSVASLTTIGTPHNGTSFADVGLEHGGGVVDLVASLGLDVDGFEDLTIAACTDFNERAEDGEASNNVEYRVYSSFQPKARIAAPLQPSWQIIRDRQGEDNDGLVPVSSQEWTPTLSSSDGRVKAVIRRQLPFGADHLNQTGSWDPNELSGLSPFRVLRGLRIRSYERAIRDAYLGIAREVTQGD